MLFLEFKTQFNFDQKKKLNSITQIKLTRGNLCNQDNATDAILIVVWADIRCIFLTSFVNLFLIVMKFHLVLYAMVFRIIAV